MLRVEQTMKAIMRSRAAAKRQELIAAEVDRVITHLGRGNPSCRCVKEVAQKLLLNSPYFFNGRNLNITSKSLGAGVYEVYAKE